MSFGLSNEITIDASLSLTADIETPAVLVDLDVLEHNLDEMALICREGSVELMPHAKTHRTPEIGLMQLSRGARGLCVAKLGEAEGFADAGVTRMMIAYPLVGPDKLARAAALAQRAQLTLGTDSLEGSRAIGAYFASLGQSVDMALLVDVGFGREGVSLLDAGRLGTELARVGGIRLTTVVTHEGTAYAATSRSDLAERATAAAAAMVSVADAIQASGAVRPRVSLGSSAAARLAATHPGVDQVRPGIYAFNDRSQIALGNATPASCAVRVLATVVSNPEPGRACIDAGSKTLSRDPVLASGVSSSGFGLLTDLPGWRIDALSEEHGWLRWHGTGQAPPLQIGRQVQIIPNHVCMVFSGLRESVAFCGGQIRAVWPTLGVGASR